LSETKSETRVFGLFSLPADGTSLQSFTHCQTQTETQVFDCLISDTNTKTEIRVFCIFHLSCCCFSNWAAGRPPRTTERSASPPPAATDIDAHAAKRRIAAVVRAQVAAQREGCTFAPATNARSKELVEKSALFKQVREGGRAGQLCLC
jgi:hypothetical protein